MRNMRSNRRRKKDRVYYTKLELRRGRKKKSTIEKLVSEVAKHLPKLYQEFIDPSIIKSLTNQIWVDSFRSFPVYSQLYENAKSAYKHSWTGTKNWLYKIFRTDAQTSSMYNKYNSYMYRNGYSASKYWFNNVDMEEDGEWILTTCELPKLTKGVHYEVLEFNYNRSTHEAEAYLIKDA